jgi:hypothetical protein
MCLNCTGEYIGAEPVQVINIEEAARRDQRIARTA